MEHELNDSVVVQSGTLTQCLNCEEQLPFAQIRRHSEACSSSSGISAASGPVYTVGEPNPVKAAQLFTYWTLQSHEDKDLLSLRDSLVERNRTIILFSTIASNVLVC